MKFAFALLASAVAVLGADAGASASAIEKLSSWLAKARDARGSDAEFAEVPLTKGDAERAAKLLWEDHAAAIRGERKAEMDAKAITATGKTMKFEKVEFGRKEDAPAGGRSLFISLHGGGGAPQELNDSQWKNQVALARAYKPTEGIYIAPRAPTNSWNLWHERHIDALFDRLIENCVVLENVNPDRVYVLGYSAGGDGVYQLGPRMADRWAAAAMMAGHPNETKPAGLRNVPFAIQVGEKDGAYNRNKVAADWGRKLDELRAADPSGYEHFTELHAGKGHWMDMEDRKAIRWMEKFTRNPLPEKIVWRQDDVTHERMYWLAVPKGGAKAGQEITAARKGQEITLEVKDVKAVTVMVSDAMMDLDAPVVISAGGKERHNAKAVRTIGTIAKTLAGRGDPRLMFSATISIEGL
jgi:predicted esterase